jgi:hypothetical protein
MRDGGLSKDARVGHTPEKRANGETPEQLLDEAGLFWRTKDTRLKAIPIHDRSKDAVDMAWDVLGTKGISQENYAQIRDILMSHHGELRAFIKDVNRVLVNSDIKVQYLDQWNSKEQSPEVAQAYSGFKAYLKAMFGPNVRMPDAAVIATDRNGKPVGSMIIGLYGHLSKFI